MTFHHHHLLQLRAVFTDVVPGGALKTATGADRCPRRRMPYGCLASRGWTADSGSQKEVIGEAIENSQVMKGQGRKLKERRRTGREVRGTTRQDLLVARSFRALFRLIR